MFDDEEMERPVRKRKANVNGSNTKKAKVECLGIRINVYWESKLRFRWFK